MPQRLACKLVGVSITPLKREELLLVMSRLLTAKRKSVVLGHNLHSAYLYHDDAVFRRLYDRADVVLADGKPIEMDAKRSARKLGIDIGVERLGTTDWLFDWLSTLPDGKIYVVGSTPSSNRKFQERLKSVFPGLEILGEDGAAWNVQKELSAVSNLNAARPDIVIVGLGMPLQERFLENYWSQLPAATYLAVGGAIDQLSGVQTLAPRWLGRLGLEWLWRLAASPRRLGYRYLIEPWKLLAIRIRNTN